MGASPAIRKLITVPKSSILRIQMVLKQWRRNNTCQTISRLATMQEYPLTLKDNEEKAGWQTIVAISG